MDFRLDGNRVRDQAFLLVAASQVEALGHSEVVGENDAVLEFVRLGGVGARSTIARGPFFARFRPKTQFFSYVEKRKVLLHLNDSSVDTLGDQMKTAAERA